LPRANWALNSTTKKVITITVAQNYVEAEFVHIMTHQTTIVNQQDHKNQQDRQHGCIQILSYKEHLDSGSDTEKFRNGHTCISD
jgi:hypothetical protein